MDKIEITPEFMADLKAKAEKATPILWIANFGNPKQDVKAALDAGTTSDAEYIIAANPQLVLALIWRLENLELMSRQWRTKFKDRGAELHIKRNLFQKNKKRMMRLEKQICKLEKEASWLADNLAERDCPHNCPHNCPSEEAPMLEECALCWRKAAKAAIADETGVKEVEVANGQN